MSSLGGGVRGVTSAIVNKMTPECVNLGRSIKTSAILAVVMIVIVVILLVASILYSYLKKTADPDGDKEKENEEHKKKTVAFLAISGTVIAFLTTFVSIWQLSVASKAVQSCLGTS